MTQPMDRAPARLTQSRIIDGLQGAGGVHPGFRRNHAKGLCFSGTFETRCSSSTRRRGFTISPLPPRRIRRPASRIRRRCRILSHGIPSSPVRWAMVPLRWRLVVTLAEATDQTTDATLPWPESRRRIDAGILTVEQVSSEDDGPCTEINFDPLVLPPGIEPSDDPLLSARSAVYALSHTLRSAERSVRPPSAVTPIEAARGVKP